MKRLRPTFLLGFLISPAINVTFSQATLLNTEPTIAELIKPIIRKTDDGALNSDHPAWLPASSLTGSVNLKSKPVAQLAFHISALAAMSRPNTINANNEKSLPR